MTITVRHVENRDSAALQDIFSCPRAQGETTHLPYPSMAEWEKRTGQSSNGTYFLVAEEAGLVIGQITLWIESTPRRRHVATIGMAVHDDHTGKGVGNTLMEAVLELTDNWLNIRRIELEVFCDNKPAIALYQKFGFVVEGEAKDFAFKNGKYVDALYMARII
ncbi:GNAT family N-acetyltransferase [Veronia pacifica]|uniref:GCN5 family acetyltransferase n=1 Tax=Veronia pacifica TaxID=1080227 RepID=A0A1C3E7I3_9GAMM|nr:GNAT family N-acetyltransferase [Veronia pacifica]ODA29202.1 GCN5 family acetyltransferase [Veronia pacifica]